MTVKMEDMKKRGRGRPSRSFAARRVNVFIEESLYNYVLSQKGAQTVTEYINNLIRKEVEAKKR